MTTNEILVDDSVAYLPRCIVSGGQTGVDRAALDVAIALGIEHGGWCPRGRLAEDGTIPSRYSMREHESAKYAVRTRQNVIDSDATLILCERALEGGTALTSKICSQLAKPQFIVRIDRDGLHEVRDWLAGLRPATLNVAGSRESTFPGIYDRSMKVLLTILES